MSDMKIYVACLASYNAGRLHGVWIDCEGKDADALQDEVNAMLRASPEPNVRVACPTCEGTGVSVAAIVEGVQQCEPCGTCRGLATVPSAEEWAIHDHEGFGRAVGEYTRLPHVAALAEAIAEHGAAFIAFLENQGGDDIGAAVEDFEDAYQGDWDSEKAFAENLLDDMGELKDDSMLARYFDYDAFARDLFMGDYWRDDDTGAVFRNC